jgi:transcriptional regulator with XRE-family HTH domain
MKSKKYRDSYVAAHISNTIASQIAALREARGWTQKQLADKTGMKQSRISALENPNYENFTSGTLRRIASAFDVALTIRFTPFSELAQWTAELSPDRIAIPDFANDNLTTISISSGSITAAARSVPFIAPAAGVRAVPTEWSEPERVRMFMPKISSNAESLYVIHA